MRTSKKLLSFFLAVVMVVTSCSVGITAFAQTNNPTIWSTNNDSDDAYAALNNLADKLPALLMGIEGISAYVADPVYAKYAQSDYGKTADELTQEEKDEIKAKATIQDVLGGLQPFLLETLAGVSQQEFVDWFETPEVSGYTGAKSPAAAYNFFIAENPDMESLFTLFTLCAAYKDNTDLSSDTREELTEWFNKLGSVLMAYIDFKNASAEKQAQIDAIASQINDSLIEQPGNENFSKHYTNATLQELKDFSFTMTADEQALVDEQINNFKIQLQILGFNIPMNDFADYVYYALGAGSAIVSGNIGTYAQLMNEAGEDVVFSGDADFFGLGTDVSYNITSNITAENFADTIINATTSGSGLSEREIVKMMAAASALNGKTVAEYTTEKNELEANIPTYQAAVAGARDTLYSHTKKYVDANGGETWFTLTGSNSKDAQATAALEDPDFVIGSANAWNTYATNNSGKRPLINAQTKIWYDNATALTAAQTRVNEINAILNEYNSAAATVDALSDDYIHSYLQLRAVNVYAAIVLAGESTITDSQNYFYVMLGAAKKYAGKSQSAIMADAAKLMPNQSSTFNLSQSDYETMAAAIAGVGSNLDSSYFTEGSAVYEDTTYYLPDAVKGTALAEYFAMINDQRSSDADAHRLGLYDAFNSATPSSALDNYYSEAYAYAATKACMEALGSTTFVLYRGTFLNERMDLNAVINNKLMEAISELIPTEEFVPTDAQKAIINDRYDLTGDTGKELLNKLLNDTIGGALQMELMGKTVTDIINGFLETPVDLNVAVGDLWQRVYDDPVKTIFELLPVLVVAINEIVEPLVFNNNSDDPLYSALRGGLLAAYSYDAGSYVGISQLHFDLNELLPNLMDWLLKGTYDNVEYYPAETVTFKEYNGSAFVDKVMGINDINTGDLKNYRAFDADGNELKRIDGDPVTYSYLGMEDTDLLTVLAQNPEAQFTYSFTYEGDVPKITGIYIADKALRDAQISDLYSILEGAIGNQIAGYAIADVITEIATLFDVALHEFVDTPELRNQIKCLPNSGQIFSIESRGLNNLMVAIPELFDIMDDLAAEKYASDKDNWTYCYDGKIVEITPGAEKYNAYNNGNGLKDDDHFFRNTVLENFKALASDTSADRSKAILEAFAQVFVGDWLNSILSLVNIAVSEDSEITQNLPIITGLLQALGGFGEESIITDVLNGVFQIEREDDESFTFELQDNGFTGLSVDNAYFLLANVDRLIEVITNLVGKFGNNDDDGDDGTQPRIADAVSADGPVYFAKASAATSKYTKDELSNATDLINNLDKLLSSLLSDSTFNEFSIDDAGNIAASLVKLVSNYLGDDCKTEIMRYVNSYVYQILGHDKNVANDEHQMDDEVFYSNESLTNFVAETYLLIERIVELYLDKQNPLGDDYTLEGGTTAHYNLIVEAIEGVISPDVVALRLGDYSDAQATIDSYNCWHDVTDVTSRGNSQVKIDWGFSDGDKESWFKGCAASFRLISSLLGVILVETGYYETIIGPVLEAICEPNGVTVDTAAEYGKKTNGYYDEAIIGLVRPLKDLLNKGFDKPVTTIIKTVQGIAGILDDNSGVTIASILNGAITPIDNELNGAYRVFSISNDKLRPLSPVLALVMFGLRAKIDEYKDPSNIMIGKDDTKYPLSGANLVNIINTYLASTGIQLLDIDWAKLAKASTPAEALLRIVEYVFDVVLDNENLQALIKLIGADGVAGQVLEALKSNKINPRDLIALLNKVLEITDSPTLAYWTFAQYVQELTENFVYPKGVSKKMADEAVSNLDALVENLFPLLSSFGVDLGGDSLSGVLNAKAFTNANITKIAKALYGALDGLDPTIKEVLKGLGIVTSTKDVAKLLTDKSYGATYSSAANSIKSASSWSKVSDNTSWGFTDGSAKAQQGFTNALAAVLRPLNSVLAVFLNEGNIAIDDTLYDLICSIRVPYTVKTLDIGDNVAKTRIAYIMYDGVLKLTVKEDPSSRSKSIASQLVLDFKALKTIDDLKIEGTNGYNSAIIPLLEALQAKDVKSYSQYQSDVKAAKDNLLLDILNPILGDNSGSVLNQLYKAPITFLTELVPNVALYFDAHGLSQAINNLLAPVTGLVADINDVININSIIKAILGTDLGSYLGNLLGVGKINVDFSDLSTINIEDYLVPIINMLLKDTGIELPDINWQKLINLGDIESYTSRATGSDGYYLTGKRIENIDNGKVLITVLRYVAQVLIDNAQTIKNLVLGIDAIAKNDMLKSIVASIFNTIGAQTPDAIIAALFYIFAGEPQDVFWDYRDYKTGNYSFSYPETVDVDFLKQLPPMLDGLISGFLDLNGLIADNLFKDELVGKIATGLYGAVEGVKVGDNSLTSILAQTDIDFSTANVANLLVDKDYGQTFESAAATIKAAGSWKNVNASSLKFGVTDRDSFFHALVAVLRPLYGVLDVLLNDADLNLFDVVRLPGSNGYSSSIVPLMEAFSMYNIKTQYQYRQDMRKEYDAILLDIINPIWDLVEDVLNAPLQTIMAIVPNLALFIGNDGLCQVINNLITPISALLDSIAPIVDANELLTQVLDGLGVNLNSILGKIGIKNLKIDLYNIDKTLEPVLGGNAIVPLINNILGIINIKGTKIDLRLNPIDWLQLASHGETVTAASQAATYDSRIFVVGDSSETLIAVLRYLIDTINTGDNFDALNSLIGGLIGGANDSISDVVGQVLGMLQGDTDEVISSLVELLQTLA